VSAHEAGARSLRDRKRQQIRERIVEAAYALFDERGFDTVTVDEIAARAEVGRTTFFRYFGDKQEVLFSRQTAFLQELADRRDDEIAPDTQDLAAALTESRRLVVALCIEASRDREHHAVYSRLTSQHPELADRHARKLRNYADLLEAHLIAHGAPRSSAILAAQIALGCFHVAWRLAEHDADALTREANTAFDTLLGDTNLGPDY
jgi:AcrR family transcriptional regulator